MNTPTIKQLDAYSEQLLAAAIKRNSPGGQVQDGFAELEARFGHKTVHRARCDLALECLHQVLGREMTVDEITRFAEIVNETRAIKIDLQRQAKTEGLA